MTTKKGADTSERPLALLAMGRALLDLYSNDAGAPFQDVKSFAAYVGGCPANISVGARRLGLPTGLLSAVGDDPTGDFVLNFLTREGIATEFIKRKTGRRTSAVLLGIEPPDKFTTIHYRDNCADMELTIDDVTAAPIAESQILLITGTGLLRDPSRSATLFAAERARAHGTKVFLDLDFRADVWTDARNYGVTIRSALRLTDVVIGTADEVTKAAHESEADIGGIAASLLGIGAEALVVKRGAESTLVFLRGGAKVDAATFPVEVYNVLGAGDAFAGGLIYGHLQGWDWHRAARMGNACGAIVVTRHGCANFMPFEHEVLEFIEERGGF
ncbi:MAG TPA: 5-dehydro-2-deoxygluconokinase [Pyrinomonadaceae bacterium]|nr:5-dehydro-2-deoxygluconokinase [Pyrinomonadaceae bacterium]